MIRITRLYLKTIWVTRAPKSELPMARRCLVQVALLLLRVYLQEAAVNQEHTLTRLMGGILAAPPKKPAQETEAATVT